MENPCWDGYDMVGTKTKDGKEVPNCVPKNEKPQSMKYRERQMEEEIDEYDVETFEEQKSFIKYMREYSKLLSEATCPCLLEAEYQGRTVKLGKPMQGDVKKFKVYVKNDKGNVVKVNFGFGGSSAGGKRMVIKKNNPERRKNFRARRHHIYSFCL